MRFLIQSCAEAVEARTAGQDAILGPDGTPPSGTGEGEAGKGRACEPFAYVSAAWHPGGELFAGGDGALVAHWEFQQQSPSALPLGTFASFADPKADDSNSQAHAGTGHYVTCCAWHPRGEILACAHSQGSFKLISRQGRVEKTVPAGQAHDGACIGLRWNLDGTALATCGEDGKVKLWSKTGMLRSSLAAEQQAVYCVAFSPDSNLLALCSGKHVVVKRIGGTNAQRTQFTGAVEGEGGAGGGNQAGGMAANSRSIRWRAHDGVVLSLDWSVANGKIVSGGEDGRYKVWDAYGRLLFQSAVVGHEIYEFGSAKGSAGNKSQRGPVTPVTSVRWRPDGESFAVGTFDLLLLCDESGWVQHKSSPNAMRVLAAPPGRDTFALRGSAEVPSSLMSLAWSADGTQLACTNGNGSVFIVMVVGEVRESGPIALETEAPNDLLARHTCVDQDGAAGAGGGGGGGGLGGAEDDLLAEERLHFGQEKVLATGVGFGKVVVVTQRQTHVYDPPEWHQPKSYTSLFQQDMPVKLVVLGPKVMATTDTAGALKVVAYDTGRVLCQPKFQGMRAELLSRRSLAVADDCVAVVDHASMSSVRVFDANTGKPLSQRRRGDQGDMGTISHPQGGAISEVGLSLVGGISDRKACFVDANRDLYLSPCADQTRQPIKLCTMCDSFGWSADSSALCCVSDGKLLVWCIPDVCFLDADLLPLCQHEVPTPKLANDALAPRIVAFERGRISTRSGNGSLITYMVPLALYSLALERCVQQHRWPKAVHLCRTVSRCEGQVRGDQGHTLWACLAALALQQQHIETAKTAYASLGLIDKVQFMNFLKEVPSDEGRAAELALFKGVPPKEVEAMLLQSSLHYRAVKLNIRMFHWERALELAQRQAQQGELELVHIVLWHRRRYLLRQGRPEHLEPYVAQEDELEEGTELVDEEVKAKIQREKNKEVQRPQGMIRRSSIAY